MQKKYPVQTAVQKKIIDKIALFEYSARFKKQMIRNPSDIRSKEYTAVGNFFRVLIGGEILFLFLSLFYPINIMQLAFVGIVIVFIFIVTYRNLYLFTFGERFETRIKEIKKDTRKYISFIYSYSDKSGKPYEGLAAIPKTIGGKILPKVGDPIEIFYDSQRPEQCIYASMDGFKKCCMSKYRMTHYLPALEQKSWQIQEGSSAAENKPSTETQGKPIRKHGMRKIFSALLAFIAIPLLFILGLFLSALIS